MLIRWPYDLAAALVRTPQTLIQLSQQVETAMQRFDRLLALVESVEGQAESLVALIEPVTSQAEEMRQALNGARNQIEVLSGQLGDLGEVARSMAAVEGRLEELGEHLLAFLKLTQPIGDAQVRAQRFRDSLRLRPRREGE